MSAQNSVFLMYEIVVGLGRPHLPIKLLLPPTLVGNDDDCVDLGTELRTECSGNNSTYSECCTGSSAL